MYAQPQPMKCTTKHVIVRNLSIVSCAKDMPMKFCQRAMMREARRMRSSLTRRTRRMMRAARSSSRSSVDSSFPAARKSRSNGITETTSKTNHVRR